MINGHVCIDWYAALHYEILTQQGVLTLTPLSLRLSENPVRAFRTRFFPAESVLFGQHELSAGRQPRRGRGKPSLGPFTADQLAPGAAGGSYQGAEGVAPRHRAPHLQLLPPTGERRLRTAAELQGRKRRSECTCKMFIASVFSFYSICVKQLFSLVKRSHLRQIRS